MTKKGNPVYKQRLRNLRGKKGNSFEDPGKGAKAKIQES